MAAAEFRCQAIRFAESREWSLVDGALRHRTGGFFSLVGVAASAREGPLDGHQQLIVLQTEIAINGFLLQARDGRSHLLFHGRVEPGNVGGMQLAPTVQSTPSNYRAVHHGRRPGLVEYFLEAGRGEAVLESLQSEEATRYHGKYNRNTVVRLEAGMELEAPAGFRWYDLAAIRALMGADNVVNTDARSVLACLDWKVLADGEPFAAGDAFARGLRRSFSAAAEDDAQSDTEIFAWLSRLRARLGLRTRLLPLGELANWVIDDDSIREREPRLGFRAGMYRVVARGREVDAWDQPLIASDGVGRLGLVCQARRGVLCFLVKASREIGFLEGVQLAPSIAVSPGRRAAADDPVEAALVERIDSRDGCEVLRRCRQSEEGGRFYREQNDYEVVQLDGGVELPESGDYRWMTLAQIRRLIPVSGMFGMEFRGALSMLLVWL